MTQGTGEPNGTTAVLLAQLLARHTADMARIDQRLTALEARCGERLTPTQWLKILSGLALPLIALAMLLTGNPELARRILTP